MYELAAGEVYQIPARDLAELAGVSKRRHRALWDVVLQALETTGEEESRLALSDVGKDLLIRLVDDLNWLREQAPKRPTGEVLYRFLERSGWLERLSGSQEQEDERKVQNLARFFEIVRDYAELARLGHVSRARVTQIMNLNFLAPDIIDDPVRAGIVAMVEAARVAMQ